MHKNLTVCTTFIVEIEYFTRSQRIKTSLIWLAVAIFLNWREFVSIRGLSHEGCILQWLVPILDFGHNLYFSKSNCCYRVLVSSCFGSCPDRIMRERDGGEQMCIFIREEIRARVVDGWVNSSTMSWCEPLACPNLLLLTFTFLCRVRKLIFTCDFVAKYYHFAVIRIP